MRGLNFTSLISPPNGTTLLARPQMSAESLPITTTIIPSFPGRPPIPHPGHCNGLETASTLLPFPGRVFPFFRPRKFRGGADHSLLLITCLRSPFQIPALRTCQWRSSLHSFLPSSTGRLSMASARCPLWSRVWAAPPHLSPQPSSVTYSVFPSLSCLWPVFSH